VLVYAEDPRQYTYLRNLEKKKKKKKTLLSYRAEVIFKPFSHWKFKEITKKWVWKEKSVKHSIFAHCQISKF
jgi:hypothetical protein